MFSKVFHMGMGLAGCVCLFFAISVLIFYTQSFHAGTLLMLLSGLLFSANGFFHSALKKHLPSNFFTSFLFIGTVFYFLFCLCFFVLLYLYGRPTTPPNPNDSTVIVLGSKVTDGRPSLTLQYRLDKAADYLNEHPEANCVVSGGQGNEETETEASVMAQYLISKGISADRVYEEDKSLDTIENLSFSNTIIQQENLSENLVVSTNSFHEMRSQMLAHTVGFANVYSLPSQTPPLLLLSYYFREILSMGKIIVSGNFSFLPSPFHSTKTVL